jgi:hypothetical protein
MEETLSTVKEPDTFFGFRKMLVINNIQRQFLERCIGSGQSFNAGKSMGKTWPDIKILRNKNVYVFVS